MSLANPPTRSDQHDVCDYPDCTNEYDITNGADGHCSEACAIRHRGRNLLQYLKHDHRFCYTCFRQIKEIDRPTSRQPDCVIGFQYRTRHGTTGQIAHQIDEYTEFIREGTICRCGNASHQAGEEVIQDLEFRTVVGNLYYALERFRREGQHDKTIDITALTSALRDQKSEAGWDFDLAIGHAIQDA